MKATWKDMFLRVSGPGALKGLGFRFWGCPFLIVASMVL